MTLWTASDAAAATQGTAIGDWSVSGISIDTRTIEFGDLFVALTAARDAHDFVAQALEKGAGAALVSRIPEGVTDNAPLLLVKDVQTALEDLGRAGRARTNARVVAITGSVGKTSTKEMLRAILGDQGRVHASVASYNNHWGVPLTLARMPADSDFAVIEIGMNHPGEIAPLAKMARPHVAMITTVAAAHLEAFDNIEGIALEKASILEGLEYGGDAILNNDCSTAAILQSKAHDLKRRDIGFGRFGFDFKMEKCTVHRDVTVVEAVAHDAPLLFKIAAAGEHFAINGLGALAAAQALGADLALAAQSLGRWTPYQGRGAREVIVLDPGEPHLKLELIDESYNANPTSMAAALAVLAIAEANDEDGKIHKGRRIAVIGDMKELGANGAEMHAELAQLDATKTLEEVHCVGPMMGHLHKALPEAQRGIWTQTAEEMATHLKGELGSGDVVMVKGSLSMQLAKVVESIRKMGQARTAAPVQDT
ncbi:MAG: UDP-N-acetylmuramoyl-tripeptide--D-alanyl-D-alanine ligase [Paracoccaceae bacterium]